MEPFTSDVAIIGMAGRFPGARSVDELWKNLRDGVESISFFSDEELLTVGINPDVLNNQKYVKAKGILEDIEFFDAAFFGFNPREAEMMDPQHRLFLECAWEALENAGYSSETDESRVGVYAGTSISTYLLSNLYPNSELVESIGMYQMILGNDKDFLPTRVSYKCNLTGPSLAINTSCSSSLVAIHLACQSLLQGECDIALAGGSSITIMHKSGYWYQEGGIASPDGHCRAFDKKARGTVDGNGLGIVVLKRLRDAKEAKDTIRAVLKGSAINNDGAWKVGYTAPSVQGQAEVITEALAMARAAPETVSYIEAHGTGTELGDTIEVAALSQVFCSTTAEKRRCALGSVKTNLGHLDAAAGVTGLIKTVLALQHKMLPPSLHFEEPNPNLDLENSPFYVNASLSAWETGRTPRRAGVSSFGIGGTNAHVVLEEAPASEASEPARPWQLLVLSAKTETALEAATTRLAEHLQQHPEVSLPDVAYTLQLGRRAFAHRRVLVCQERENAIHELKTGNPGHVFTRVRRHSQPQVVFMFPGQGAQYVHMARELYQEEPILRAWVDHCAALLMPCLGCDLREVLYPDPGQAEGAAQKLKQTVFTQPALFVIEYALAQLWLEWGVQPVAMIGHSIGEYVAACLAGVFSLEDALKLVTTRGRLMQSLPVGSMLSVALSEADLTSWLMDRRLSPAAFNGPSLSVVSGPQEAIAGLEARLTARNIACHQLQTTRAFHSMMMDPIRETFQAAVENIQLKPPTRPYISNVTGTWIRPLQATDPAYWATQLRQPVRFAQGLAQLLEESGRVLLEVGPGRTLKTLARQQIDEAAQQMTLSSVRHPQEPHSDEAFLLGTVGQLWLAGIQPDWKKLYAHERRQRLPLPTYPFERQRYWVDPPGPARQVKTSRGGADQTSSLDDLSTAKAPSSKAYSASPGNSATTGNKIERSIAALWQQFLGLEQIDPNDNFFELGGHSLLATQIITRLRDIFHVELQLQSIFEAPTIAELAIVVEEMLLEKIEALPEDEIRNLL